MTRRPQHPHRIFDEAHPGIANRSDDPCFEIGEPADIVDDRVRGDVVEQAVDREVASERVLFRRAERVVAVEHGRPHAPRPFAGAPDAATTTGGWSGGATASPGSTDGSATIAPERRHLNRLRSELHVGQPKPATDNPAVPERAS